MTEAALVSPGGETVRSNETRCGAHATAYTGSALATPASAGTGAIGAGAKETAFAKTA